MRLVTIQLQAGRRSIIRHPAPDTRHLFAMLLVFILAIPVICAPHVKTLADGVTLIQDINTDPASPLVVNALKIDLKKPGVKVASALAQDGVIESDPTKGREIVSRTVARTAALAGVNADFFPYTGDPLGMAVHNGELVSEPMDRAAIGITSSGRIIIDKLSFTGTLTASSGETFPIRGLNRQRGKNEIVIYAPVFGVCTGAKDGVEVPLALDAPLRANRDVSAVVTADPSPAAGMTIPKDGILLSANGAGGDWLAKNIHSGDKLTLRLNVKADSGRVWDSVMEAVGGGPMLVQNGNVCVDGEEEKFSTSLIFARHPRTAAGVTASGELLLVTVDGRQSISQGMTLAELACLMKNLGAVEAINLDGGGSSSLSILGTVTNSPSEGKERPVANALLVYGNAECGMRNAECGQIAFAETCPLIAISGEGRMLRLVDGATSQPITDEAKKNIIWGTTGGIGFVNQAGWFVPINSGSGKIVAFAGQQKIELPVTVVPGKLANLTAEIVPDETGAENIGKIEVHLTDANGNGISNQTVRLSVKGGTADSLCKTTDSKGIAEFAIVWETTASQAKVKVTSAGLTTEAK